MVGHLAHDERRDETGPAVLLCHEGPGLDDHVRGHAERLAELGYCAFALDYLGGGRQPPLEEALATIAEMMADLSIARSRAMAGLAVLLDQDQVDPRRVAAVGYCWGGAMALEVARSGADIKALVGFHSSLTVSPDSQRISAKALFCLGAEDPLITQQDRIAFEDHLRAASVGDWRMELYGGVGHSFTNRDADALQMPGIAYNAAADERSWSSMLRLLEEALGPCDNQS